MRTRVVAVGALAAFLIVALWYTVLLKPLRAETSDTKEQVEEAERATQAKENELASLEALAESGPEMEADVERLEQAVPRTPAMASFYDAMDAIELESGVSMVSITASPPTLGNGASTIPLTINVEGGYFQVLNYLTLFESMPRLVVTDSINVTAEGGNGSSASSSSPGADDTTDAIGGAPTLTAQLTGRALTQAAPTTQTGQSTTRSSGGATTTTTPEAKG